MSTKSAELTTRFTNAGLQFDEQAGGLVRAVFSGATAAGELFLHGAHCAAWQPAGQRSVLWMSQLSYYEAGKPIRGGVPICFPWFGAHATDKAAPGHGLARLQEWELKSAQSLASGGLRLVCATELAPFQLEYAVEFDKQLKLSLTTRLGADHPTPQRFEDALHTYFSVSDIKSVSITGLENRHYIDKVGQVAERSASGGAIVFTEETDRIYPQSSESCVIHDPDWQRQVIISKSGSNSTIVWNPWIAKSARMPDFGNDEWTGMLCIETANVGSDAITLEPGQQHTTTALIAVSDLTSQ